MKTTRILTIAIVLLLITNLVLVAFMVMDKKKSGEKRNQGFRAEAPELMVKTLKMSDQQQADFKKMKEEHFKMVKPYFDSVRVAKRAFFDLVKKPDLNDSLMEVYSLRVFEKQSMLDKITLNHFRSVRNIFTADQQPGYDSLLRKMWSGRGKKDSSGKKEKN
ncbi:MAG: hypothetical protein IPG86_10735 [Chitinophagaceae bacterium]|nr:hypothetical protein [Chitinophagaceae bacterium]